MKILLIEDDNYLSLAISEALNVEKYRVDRVDNGQSGLEMAESIDYDLILLDIILPKLDGLEVCRHLRAKHYQTPILLLTAKNRPGDCVVGLKAGADDYLTKPFSWGELLARIKALLRRGRIFIPQFLRWEALEVNLDSHKVTYDGKLLNLTPLEYGLLQLFLRHPQQVFNRQKILDLVWPMDQIPGEETVTAHIKGLRSKLKAAGMRQEIIETVYGLGYRLANPSQPSPNSPLSLMDNRSSDDIFPLSSSLRQAQSGQEQNTSLSKVANPSKSLMIPSEEFQQKISDIWQQTKETVEQDLKTLVQLILSLPSETDQTSVTKEKAIALAHRLGGTLAMFGKTQESYLVRQIEELLTREEDRKPRRSLLDLVTSLQQTWKPELSTWGDDAVNKAQGLLCIGVEEQWLQALKTLPFLENCPIEVVSTFKKAQGFLATHQPRAVVIDLELTETREKGLTFIRGLGQKTPDLPFFVLDSKNDLSYRLDITHSGSGMFLHKPLTSDRLLKAVINELLPCPTQGVTLMLVDDDPQFVGALTPILISSGFDVISLCEPQYFWQVLEKTNPDLLILDVEMRPFNGLNLSKVVRKDDRFCSLPIIIISQHQNKEMLHQGFVVGVDDYIFKPIKPQELISSILRHLERKT